MSASLTVVLTGATGFIGSHVLKVFIARGWNVKAVKRSTSSLDRVNKVKGDGKLTWHDIDRVGIETLFSGGGINAVVHLATNYGKDCEASDVIDDNLLFPVRLWEYAMEAGVGLFVNTDTFFSSYRGYRYLPLYTLSKKHLSEWLENGNGAIKVVNMRLHHVYGPDDSSNKFVPWIIGEMQQNRPEICLTDGLQERDFVYVDDVAEAYVTVIEKMEGLDVMQTLDVGSGELHTVREFVEVVWDEIPTKSRLLFGELDQREGEISTVEVNIAPLRRLGWRPLISLLEGIKKTISAMKN